MLAYILRRIALMIPVLFTISVISFVIIQLPPGDFLTTLQLVLDQYPSAKLEADERGLLLRWSPPPVLCRRSAVPKMPEPEPPADGGKAPA